jgi:hypothetical protein
MRRSGHAKESAPIMSIITDLELEVQELHRLERMLVEQRAKVQKIRAAEPMAETATTPQQQRQFLEKLGMGPLEPETPLGFERVYTSNGRLCFLPRHIATAIARSAR